MQDAERILGRLEEFKDQTGNRLEKIEKKIDILHEFRFKVAGAAALLSILVTLAVQMLKFWVTN